MRTVKRFLKRIIILGVYALIVFIVVSVSFILSRKLQQPVASCNDGILNQNEIGVDCGGPCAPCGYIKALSVKSVGFIETDPMRYDLYALISNPNDVYGLKELKFKFLLFGSDSEVAFAQVDGVSYVAPRTEKLIIAPAVDTKKALKRVEIRIPNNPYWQQMDDYERPEITLISSRLTIEGPNIVLKGVLLNEDVVGFSLIEVLASLVDAQGEILAVGKTDVRTVEAKERREFVILWPRTAKLNSIADYKIYLLTNVFDENNIFQRFDTTPEPFQRF